MGLLENVIHHHSVHGADAAHDRAPDREYDWTTYAALAGVVGAFLVAALFLVVDILSGRPPLWTPAVLGAALFRGQAVGAAPGFDPTAMMPLVLGYTVLHGFVFVTLGALAASSRLTRERVHRFGWGVRVSMAVALFAGLEITFAALGWAVGPDVALMERLDFGWVAAANALAAIAMTFVIGAAAASLARANPR